MRTKKQLRERRQRNLELARLDAARRCPTCKRDLYEIGHRWESFLIAGEFCSEDCLKLAQIEAERR